MKLHSSSLTVENNKCGKNRFGETFISQCIVSLSCAEVSNKKGGNGLKFPESISLSDVLGGTKSVEGHERTDLNWREQNESGNLLEPAHLLLGIMN